MNKEAEKRIAAKLAKTMAMLCVRNTHLETIHAGKTPVTRTGDWSGVIVVDADGNRIPWADVSHISDDELRDLMRDIVNRLYTFHLYADAPGLQACSIPDDQITPRRSGLFMARSILRECGGVENSPGDCFSAKRDGRISC